MAAGARRAGAGGRVGGVVGANDLLGDIYADSGVPVGDVARAFHADDFSIVPVIGLPVNVVVVCQWTWMCKPPPQGPDIHPNRIGYFVIALVLAATLH